MSDKIKNIVVSVLFCLFVIGGAVFCLVKPADAYSMSERRELKQFPKITWKSVLDTSWMKDFEKYTLDQFPLREPLRQIKAVSHYYLFAQKDNNDIYLVGDQVSKLEAPLKEDQVLYGTERFKAWYEKFFADLDADVYYSVIPDKNYFLAEANGYPSLDYDKLLSIVHENLPDFTYIDIFDQLTIDNYYNTDTHWKQETLSGVVNTLSEGLGVADFIVTDYTENTHTPFYGVYTGQASLPMDPDTLTYLTSDLLDNCIVTNYNSGKGEVIPVYDLTKLNGADPYETFLGGNPSLLTIENPNAQSGRELVIFRDSFGSSITPLLACAYEKITLIDIRVLNFAYTDISKFVDISGTDDILFLYSTLVLNNASELK